VNETRIAFFGNFGTQNLGNECTLQAIVHNVAARLPHASLFVICPDPDETVRIHRLPSVPMRASYVPGERAAPADAPRPGLVARLRQSVGRFLSEVRGWFTAYRVLDGTSALVVAGTGLLTDHGESILGFPYEIFKWVSLAQLRGVKVRIVAVGAGPICGALGRFFIRQALKAADYRSFRDAVSRSRLELAGMDTGDDPIVPDLAFSLPESLFRTSPGAAPDRPVIGVGVFDYYGPHPDRQDAEAFHEAYVEKMVDFIAWLLREDYTVRILIGDLSYDLEVRAAILARLERRRVAYRSGQLISEDIDSVADLLSQLAATTLIVSPRYHNLLLGIMLGKPVLSISYDPKNDALLEGVGLGEYRQPIESFDVDLLKAQLVKLERDALRIEHRIRERAASYRHLWEREYPFVLAGLAQPLASQGVTRAPARGPHA
jgi:polysaccharide pyruvyl transferase WcaK-like protein